MSQRSSHLIRVDVGSDLSSLNEYVNLSANDWSISESNMDVPYSWYADTSGYPWQAFQWVTEGNSSATFKFQGEHPYTRSDLGEVSREVSPGPTDTDLTPQQARVLLLSGELVSPVHRREGGQPSGFATSMGGKLQTSGPS